MALAPAEFIAKWRASELKESSAAQEHFIDLCHLLGEPTPADVDPRGDWYAFERGATKTTGGEGWADVWKRGHFGWEYKGKRKDLGAAFVQLQQYALALENPPLLVVSDIERIRIHTNWTNSVSVVHEIGLDDLRDAAKREQLKWVLTDPEKLRPGKTRESLTRDAAGEFAELALRLRAQGIDPQVAAHFINRLVFCMFAEDSSLLPNQMFSRMLDHAKDRPDDFPALTKDLFTAMRAGGRIGFEHVDWFNGGLFDDDTVLTLDRAGIATTIRAARLDWSEIDPSIFGTLFERGLDPDKRSQLGAHYTDRDKIMMIVEPVVIRPWLAEWAKAKPEIEAALTKAVGAATPGARTRTTNAATTLYRAFLDRLRAFTMLDPACGSGNFLYLGLLALKDLEHRVMIEAEAMGLAREFPQVGPQNVKGIEINPYAAELARVTVWIGEIQWMRKNGFSASRDPILKPLDNIECRDALLNPDGSEAAWPKADVIIGNPPFLGSRNMAPTMGRAEVARLREVYKTGVPRGADLVCYWFAKAWKGMQAGSFRTAGLVATNSIAGGSSRKVLEPIAGQGGLFEVWTDQPWTIEGAAVRVVIVCFSAERAAAPKVDDNLVATIHSDLRPPLAVDAGDLTKAKKLSQNHEVGFQGVVLRAALVRSEVERHALPPASFTLDGNEARRLLLSPLNPNSRPNGDVLRRFMVGDDVTTRISDRFVINFEDRSEIEASLFEEPFKFVLPVRAHRALMSQPQAARTWWQLWRPRRDMFVRLRILSRYIGTPTLSKHRLFVWIDSAIVPDHQLIAIAREDDTTFGILHSRFHETWALRLGTSLEDRPRYTPSTTFETFPFPEGLTPDIPATDYAADPRAIRIAAAAKRLNELRENWLNPADLVVRVPEVVPGYPDRLLPTDENAAKVLAKRTLTKLYNERPAWLDHVHRDLDAAVAAAYGWPEDISDDDALARLFALNQQRSAAAAPR